jgi:hypothetical protein
MKIPHPHAELAMQYAQDMLESEVAWQNWQFRPKDTKEWRNCGSSPSWMLYNEYRRKPPVMLINGFEVPQPEQHPLEIGTQYFTLSISGSSRVMTWESEPMDYKLLKKGLVHLTSEAAAAHSQALTSFSELK